MEIELGLELTLRAEADHISLGTPDRWSSWFGNWLPGDPPEVSGLRVYLGDKDVTSELTAEEIEYIENQLIEEKSEEVA